MTAQLSKSREQIKATPVRSSAHADAKADEDHMTPLLRLASQRIAEGRLIEPERDSARFYVQEALREDSNSGPAQDLERALALRLLAETHAVIDRRDFARAAVWLDAAKGIATPTDIEAAETLLAGARHQANADAWAQLLKNAGERLQQDRLIEPANDNAKYYLLTLRGLDPGNAGLLPAMQDLGTRLTAKARRALALEQYDAARSWLDEIAAIGFSSGESAAVEQDLDTAVANQKFLTNVIAANDLTVVKSVQPVYPARAEQKRTKAGWNSTSPSPKSAP